MVAGNNFFLEINLLKKGFHKQTKKRKVLGIKRTTLAEVLIDPGDGVNLLSFSKRKFLEKSKKTK